MTKLCLPFLSPFPITLNKNSRNSATISENVSWDAFLGKDRAITSSMIVCVNSVKNLQTKLGPPALNSKFPNRRQRHPPVLNCLLPACLPRRTIRLLHLQFLQMKRRATARTPWKIPRVRKVISPDSALLTSSHSPSKGQRGHRKEIEEKTTG